MRKLPASFPDPMDQRPAPPLIQMLRLLGRALLWVVMLAAVLAVWALVRK
jgi:hypothetical protein